MFAQPSSWWPMSSLKCLSIGLIRVEVEGGGQLTEGQQRSILTPSLPSPQKPLIFETSFFFSLSLSAWLTQREISLMSALTYFTVRDTLGLPNETGKEEKSFFAPHRGKPFPVYKALIKPSGE